MNILGNILWLLLGGFMVAVEYFFLAVVLCCTIIGIPFGLQLFKIGILTLWPFGYTTYSTPQSNGCLSVVMNIIWMFTGGLCIALTHLLWGILLCITIIGIPFGRQHFKLMALSFTPFGQTIAQVN